MIMPVGTLVYFTAAGLLPVQHHISLENIR